MDALKLHYDVDGEDFSAAGEASSNVKKVLRQLGFPQEAIRRTAICMYEGEINVVIHAGGGFADVTVEPERITIVLTDQGTKEP